MCCLCDSDFSFPDRTGQTTRPRHQLSGHVVGRCCVEGCSGVVHEMVISVQSLGEQPREQRIRGCDCCSSPFTRCTASEVLRLAAMVNYDMTTGFRSMGASS